MHLLYFFHFHPAAIVLFARFVLPSADLDMLWLDLVLAKILGDVFPGRIGPAHVEQPHRIVLGNFAFARLEIVAIDEDHGIRLALFTPGCKVGTPGL